MEISNILQGQWSLFLLNNDLTISEIRLRSEEKSRLSISVGIIDIFHLVEAESERTSQKQCPPVSDELSLDLEVWSDFDA